jgi:hypothetical protein
MSRGSLIWHLKYSWTLQPNTGDVWVWAAFNSSHAWFSSVRGSLELVPDTALSWVSMITQRTYSQRFNTSEWKVSWKGVLIALPNEHFLVTCSKFSPTASWSSSSVLFVWNWHNLEQLLLWVSDWQCGQGACNKVDIQRVCWFSLSCTYYFVLFFRLLCCRLSFDSYFSWINIV